MKITVRINWSIILKKFRKSEESFLVFFLSDECVRRNIDTCTLARNIEFSTKVIKTVWSMQKKTENHKYKNAIKLENKNTWTTLMILLKETNFIDCVLWNNF